MDKKDIFQILVGILLTILSGVLLWGVQTDIFEPEFVTAASTIMLAVVTFAYVHLTWEHLDAAVRQAKASEAKYSPDINSDYYLTDEGVRLAIVNRGEGVAKGIVFEFAVKTDEQEYIYKCPIETSLQPSKCIIHNFEPVFYTESKNVTAKEVDKMDDADLWDIDREEDTMKKRGLIDKLLSKLNQSNLNSNPRLYVSVFYEDINQDNEYRSEVINDAYLELGEQEYSENVSIFSGGGSNTSESFSDIFSGSNKEYAFYDDPLSPHPCDEKELAKQGEDNH